MILARLQHFVQSHWVFQPSIIAHWHRDALLAAIGFSIHLHGECVTFQNVQAELCAVERNCKKPAPVQNAERHTPPRLGAPRREGQVFPMVVQAGKPLHHRQPGSRHAGDVQAVFRVCVEVVQIQSGGTLIQSVRLLVAAAGRGNHTVHTGRQ